MYFNVIVIIHDEKEGDKKVREILADSFFQMQKICSMNLTPENMKNTTLRYNIPRFL